MPLGQVELVVDGRNAANRVGMDEAADRSVITEVAPAGDRADQL
jgi:hypothetical protein